MTIYDFISACCSLDNVEFSIFDCNSEKTFNISEEEYSEWENYEIGGMDIWYDEKKKCIHIEFNIEIDEEDE
jgi:hypothetical protein